MSDPVTLGVLGGVAAAEGIKFLYGQAAEMLKAWRERRSKAAEAQPGDAAFDVPIVDTDVLDAVPSSVSADPAVIEREQQQLVRLVGALSPYAQGLVDIEPADAELSENLLKLRALLEAAYGQRLTFRGERREPTGTRLTVRQVVGDVTGTVVGVAADVEGPADVDIVQDAKTVSGSVEGFRGRVGG